MAKPGGPVRIERGGKTVPRYVRSADVRRADLIDPNVRVKFTPDEIENLERLYGPNPAPDSDTKGPR